MSNYDLLKKFKIIETGKIKIGLLTPFIKNKSYRKLSDKNYQKLDNSILEVGIINPLHIDLNNVVIDGNHRLTVGKEVKGDDYEVEFIRWNISIDSFKDKKDYDKTMALLGTEMNRSFATYDKDDFLKFLNDFEDIVLDEIDINIESINLGDMVPKEHNESLNEIPEVEENPVSQLGDVWLLGGHRIMCGDSTDLITASILMNGTKSHIAFTSPPYNAGTTPTEVNMGKKSKYVNDSDNKSQGEYVEFMRLWTDVANENSLYNFVNIQMLAGNKLALLDYLHLYKNKLAEIIIWDKQSAQPAMANNVLNSQFEFILCFSTKANRAIGTKRFRGTLSNVININKQSTNEVKEHNATFPVQLPSHFISEFTNENEIVLDLFLGSGSTLIGAENTNRRCYGMELEPLYVDVAIKRWQKLTGGAVIHEKTGKTIEDLAVDRGTKWLI